MASVYGIVRSIAKAGSAGPMLRSIVGRKPVADATPKKPAEFASLVENEIIPRLMVAHGREGDELVVTPTVVNPTISYHEAKPLRRSRSAWMPASCSIMSMSSCSAA